MKTFLDRQGKICVPSATSIVRAREGAFSCCIHESRLLLIWPSYAPDVPELPGGGIDAGENPLQANKREFWEETGFTLNIADRAIEGVFEQTVDFYADDVDQYWIYKQSFYLIRDGLAAVFFDGTRPTPEKGLMRWVELKDLAVLPLHVMHKNALVNFGLSSD